MFYLVCKNLEQRTRLIEYLKERGIMAPFHYLSLHNSPYYHDRHDGRALPNAERFSDCLLRLPLFFNLGDQEVLQITESVQDFFKR